MLDKLNLSPDDLAAFTKITVVILACMMFVVLAYLAYRWKLRSDKEAIERLNSKELRLQMEVLAAEKLTQRKALEQKQKEEALKEEKKPPVVEQKPKSDEWDDLPPLQF